ncbi:hypothetical protein RvY_08526-1 [Ramazzottius varieornatus]|uniref:Uncharacterized protein n=1 Tax=Ramazzottius varieornatus TaxID=947166 RepID=A0A1D1VE71_RAMVA|nr:hypothetical protein RvY_08526-1 [Ramazzottius varieornatus]
MDGGAVEFSDQPLAVSSNSCPSGSLYQPLILENHKTRSTLHSASQLSGHLTLSLLAAKCWSEDFIGQPPPAVGLSWDFAIQRNLLHPLRVFLRLSLSHLLVLGVPWKTRVNIPAGEGRKNGTKSRTVRLDNGVV